MLFKIVKNMFALLKTKHCFQSVSLKNLMCFLQWLTALQNVNLLLEFLLLLRFLS